MKDELRPALARALDGVEDARRALKDHPEDARALHSFRRESRRLAAVVELHASALRPVAFTRLHALVADLTEGTGKHRDADVLGDAIARQQPADGTSPDPSWVRLSKLASKMHRKKRKEDAAAAVERARRSNLREPMLQLLDAEPELRAKEPLRLVLARTAHRARSAIPADGAVLMDELHALRQELKILRDAARALGGADTALAQDAAACCDALGLATDAHLLETRASRWARHRDLLPAAASLAERAGRDAHTAASEFLKDWANGRYATLRSALDASAPH